MTDNPFGLEFIPVPAVDDQGGLLLFATGAMLHDVDLFDLDPVDVPALVRLVRKRGGRVVYPPQPQRTCPGWWRELSLAVAACVNLRRLASDRGMALGCAQWNRIWYEEERDYKDRRNYVTGWDPGGAFQAEPAKALLDVVLGDLEGSGKDG